MQLSTSHRRRAEEPLGFLPSSPGGQIIELVEGYPRKGSLYVTPQGMEKHLVREPGLETLEVIRQVALFRDVGPEGLARLADQMRLLSFRSGAIIRENDPSDGLYVIKSGLVRVTKAAEGDVAEAVLAMLRPGDSFGELGLVDGKPRSATVGALQPTECYFLDRDAFRAALKEHPEIAVGMLPALAAMVRNADRWVSAGL